MFQYIENNVFQLNPKSFMTDFETGLRSALRHVYPDSEVKGCHFHYCQAIRKNASKMPNFFSSLYLNDTANVIYHKMLALPLLRLNDILPAYQKLKEECLSENLKNIFESFLIYYERQWIVKVPKTEYY